MKTVLSLTTLLCLLISRAIFGQAFSPDDYCLVWADEFNVDGAPNPANWRYEVGYVRNSELQYYTSARAENARIEGGRLIIEARRDNWQGNAYTSASLVSNGRVVRRYGRFEIRAKIDIRSGSWPAFWTLGESGEWPSNGEIDILEFYKSKILANVAWGTNTRWVANWDSQSRLVSTLGAGWASQFHVWRMEWTPQFINLYVDDILLNTTDIRQTLNGTISTVRNPFQQPHYMVINQAIGGINGGDPAATVFPVRYEIDYVRIYQLGNCNLDCNWIEGGTARLDDCLACAGGTTGRAPCMLNCTGNLIQNPGFEMGGLAMWTGWGVRTASTMSFAGTTAAQVGTGAVEKLVNVTPNTNYTVNARGRKTGGGWFRLGVIQEGSPDTFTEFTNTAWAQVEHNFKTGNVTTARIFFVNESGGLAYADDFRLEPSGCMVSGTAESSSALKLKLYPNPSSNNFTVEVPYSGHITILDARGVVLKSFATHETLSGGGDLLPGLYAVQFRSESILKTWTWIKI